MKEALQALLVQAPLFILVGLTLATLATWSVIPLVYALLFFIFGLVLNQGIKMMLSLIVEPIVVADGTNAAAFDKKNGAKTNWRERLRYSMGRPTHCPGRNANGKCEQCRLMILWGEPLTGDYFLGMPSGHAQSMAYAATLWTLYAFHIRLDTAHLYASVCFMWLWAAATVFQRVHSRCHTWTQVGVGLSIGVALGIITHTILVANHFI